VEQARAHAERLDALLRAERRGKAAWDAERLARTVALVVHFAQTGEGGDSIHDVLASLEVLRTTPTGATQDVEELDILASDWNLALVGAHARAKLAKNQPVTARDLATLASITTNSIHLFTRTGELEPINDGRPALYDARRARKWLIERGVRGLSPRRS
jgi:hypothetical protein